MTSYNVFRSREIERRRFFSDAINGFLPRARSSGPRTSSMKNKHDENVRRVRSETASLFSSTCKLPQLDGSIASEKKTCTIRPWSRTQDELRKFKETLKSTTVTSTTASSN
ncbi:Protein CBG01527 [Caenorhabditis briggsae]|uniref:Protein CBG01527 n=1 Tax=Caenorhabditis briggsae TaxID=6238 RepID=A8WQH1_CAEBR|nr:Protein CBG01527 [Caenorhabditis briggsae]CAP22729.2 Protein CBG01527 [Caenorhabditis briggsae]